MDDFPESGPLALPRFKLAPQPVRKKKRRIWLKVLLTVLLVPFAFVFWMLVFLVTLDFPHYDEKYEAPAEFSPPQAVPATTSPETQTESHTCGLHTLRTIYLAHGLDPEAVRLRFRLGVDRPAVPGTGPWDTEGTLHPDMYRVLLQDGFRITEIDPQGTDAATALERHLQEKGLLAAVLIQRRETGHFHWVVLDSFSPANTNGEEATLRVVDSLAPEPYGEPAQNYLENHVLSLLLLETASEDDTSGKEVDVWAAHQRGIAEMKRALQRAK